MTSTTWQWPSDVTIWLIYWAVANCLLACLPAFTQRSISEMLSCRVMLPVLYFIGFILSPVLALDSGPWRGILLVPNYIDTGMLFNNMGVTIYLITYMAFFRSAKDTAAQRTTRFNPAAFLPSVPALWILLLAFTSTWLIRIDGPENILVAAYGRADRQFEEQDVGTIIRGWAAIVNGLLSFGLALIGSCFLAVALLQKRVNIFFYGTLLLLVASLPRFHGFSRAAGFAFVLAAMVILLVGIKKRPLVPFIALGSLLIGIWLSLVGYNTRNLSEPGLSGFATMAFSYSQVIEHPRMGSDSGDNIDPRINPFNNIDAWTRRASTKDYNDISLNDGILIMIGVLQPLPSALFGFEARVGESLSQVMGVEGITGITTPASAELYYALGFFGIVAFALLGLLAAYIDARIRDEQSLYARFLQAVFFLSLVIGLQHGLRAMTRPLIYAAVLSVGLGILRGGTRRRQLLLTPRRGRQSRTTSLRKGTSMIISAHGRQKLIISNRRCRDDVAKQYKDD